LSAVLDQLIKEGEMTSQDADHAASLIARDNARRVYPLGKEGARHDSQ
jgi:hypothetical protein